MAIFFVALWIVCGAWAANDASDRNKSGCLVFLLILLGGPLGLVIWLLIRDN